MPQSLSTLFQGTLGRQTSTLDLDLITIMIIIIIIAIIRITIISEIMVIIIVLMILASPWHQIMDAELLNSDSRCIRSPSEDIAAQKCCISTSKTSNAWSLLSDRVSLRLALAGLPLSTRRGGSAGSTARH